MAWHALRAAGESVTATRRLLANAPLVAWLRLSVLALFVGTLVTPFLVDFNRGATLLGSVPDSTLLVAGMLVGLAALCVGTVFEFVFLEALRGERIRLIENSGRRFRAGMEVFAFRTALAVVLGVAVGAFVLVDAPLALVPLLASLVVVLAPLDRLTVAFVVPIMLVDGRSLPEGWRAFSPALRREWREYALYLLVASLLWLAVAVVGGLAGALLAGLLLVPFAIFGSVVGGTLLAQGLSEATVGQAVIGTLAVPYLLAFVTLVLLAHVPVVAYLRYIALFVLGDTAERYDPIPRLRAAIRRG